MGVTTFGRNNESARVDEKSGYPLYHGEAIPAGTPVRVKGDGDIAPMPLGVFGGYKSQDLSATWSSDAGGTLTGVLTSFDLGSSKTLVIFTNGSAIYASIVTESGGYVTTTTPVAIASETMGTLIYPTSTNSQPPSTQYFKLNSTQYLITYVNSSAVVKGVVVTVSGTTVTAGTPTTIVPALGISASVAFFTATPLNTSGTKFIMEYLTGTNTSVIAFSISGTTITVGTALALASFNSNNLSLCYLTTEKVLVIYQNGSSQVVVNVISASTLTLSMGTAAVLATGTGLLYNIAMVPISATAAYLMYSPSITGDLWGYTITVSGTVAAVSGGSPNLTGAQSSGKSDVFILGTGTTTYVALGVRGSGQPGYYMTVISITTATGAFINKGAGPFTVIGGNSGSYGDTSCYFNPATNKFTVVMTDTQGKVTKANSVVWTPNTLTLTLDSGLAAAGVTVNPDDLTNLTFAGLLFSSTGKFIVIAPQRTAPYKFTSFVFASDELGTATKNDKFIGFMQPNGNVVLKGIAQGVSGITAGLTYYLTPKGVLTTASAGNTLVGTAISSSEILIKDYLF